MENFAFMESLNMCLNILHHLRTIKETSLLECNESDGLGIVSILFKTSRIFRAVEFMDAEQAFDIPTMIAKKNVANM